MKYYILILSIIFLLNGCNKSSSNITYITECEAGNQLNSVTHEVPPIILSPFSLCVTNDKLVILESKSDTIFNVFNIKNFQHIHRTETGKFILFRGNTYRVARCHYVLFRINKSLPETHGQITRSPNQRFPLRVRQKI